MNALFARCLAAVRAARHSFARKERFPFPRMLSAETVAPGLAAWLDNYHPGLYKVGTEQEKGRIYIWPSDENSGQPRLRAVTLCQGDMLCMDDEGRLSVEEGRVGL